MFGWKKQPLLTPQVDIHSHLIPSIDDGVRTIQDAIDVILKMKELGYKKVITTPHIHPSFPNTSEIILNGLVSVKQKLNELNIDFRVEAAAEYYVDENFMNQVKAGDVLSFGNNYVLVESSFLNKPMIFESCLFELQAKGYQPVLAHPERYRFLEGDLAWLYSLKEMGVLFQVTVSSFIGFYGETPLNVARQLQKNQMVDFLGSDLHHLKQLKFLEEGLQQKPVKSLTRSSALLNNQLL